MAKTQKNDGRQAEEFTEEEARIHKAGFTVILEGLKRGLGFDEACQGLQIVDPEMRRIVVDDYLKVTIAEQHFQGKRSLEDIAAELKISATRISEKKKEMLSEVQQAAVEHLHKQTGGPVFGEDPEGSESPGKKGH